MKLFILSISLIFSVSAFAKKGAAGIGAELLKSVKEDVSKDDASFRRPIPSRAPASVIDASTTQKIINEQKSNEKIHRNMNQIGKPEW